MIVTIDLETVAGETYLSLRGGSPDGRDQVHDTVGSWAGWRRLPSRALGHHGEPVSLYRATAWTAAALPLLNLPAAWQARWSPQATAWLQGAVYAMKGAAKALTDQSVRLLEPLARAPRRHQAQAVAALQRMGNRALLTDEMGLGKTATSLMAWHEAGFNRALVICPKSVKFNWQEEINATLLKPPLVYVIDGTPAKRNAILGFMRNVTKTGEPAIAIVNYDLLRSMNEVAWTTLEDFVHEQAVICDEFHYAKDRNAKRTQAVAALVGLASMRLGLTGTPVRNTVEDLFSQVEIIRPGTWSSYHDFASRHLVVVKTELPGRKAPVPIVRGGKNLDSLNAVVNTMRVNRKLLEVEDLPPKIRTKPLLELEGPNLALYQAMKTRAQVELERLLGETDNATVFSPAARSGLELSMRCEQIAQGFLGALPEEYMEAFAPLMKGIAERVPDYPNSLVFPKSEKLVWLMNAIEEIDGQVVVFSRFNAPIVWLNQHYGEQSTILYGKVDALERQERISLFREGKKRIMFCQVVIAEGFNLTSAHNVLFLGRDWSPAINAQAEARCHRIGTKGTVNVQIPIVRNTFETYIERKLNAKDADAQQALRNVTIRELMENL